MRAIARWVLTGAALCMAAHSESSVSVTRIWSGPDGKARAEEMAVKMSLRANRAGSEQSEAIPAAGVQLVRWLPGYLADWHTAPRRQYLIPLSGHGELELPGGRKVPLEPGRIVLLEDVTGKGHISRAVGDQPCVVMLVQASNP